MNPYIFLSGCQRSGKTLLQLILSTHPDILITPGTKSIERIMYQFRYQEYIAGDDLIRLRKIIRSDDKLAAWNLDLSPLFKLFDAYSKVSPNQAILDIINFMSTHLKPEAQFIGNKKGFYSIDGDIFKTIVPSARYIFIIRDGRAAVESMLKTQADQHNLESASETWRLKAQRIREISQQFPKDTYIVRYEELVSNPENICRSVCQFLEVDYYPLMITEYSKNMMVRHITDFSHSETYQPITTSMIHTWQQSLTSQQIIDIENIAGEELKNYCYLE